MKSNARIREMNIIRKPSIADELNRLRSVMLYDSTLQPLTHKQEPHEQKKQEPQEQKKQEPQEQKKQEPQKQEQQKQEPQKQEPQKAHCTPSPQTSVPNP